MALSGQAFVKEIQEMVRAKHSKNHPIIDMIEQGHLTREQLKGFVGQFYLFFPKPFPKPIAAMLGRCPEEKWPIKHNNSYSWSVGKFVSRKQRALRPRRPTDRKKEVPYESPLLSPCSFHRLDLDGRTRSGAGRSCDCAL